jgi:hypothetical protein
MIDSDFRQFWEERSRRRGCNASALLTSKKSTPNVELGSLDLQLAGAAIVFRRSKKFVNSHCERILSLVLLPAFLLGTLPQTACICADGHRESFCKAAGLALLPGGSSASACSGRSCCQEHKKQIVRGCCNAQHSQQTPSQQGPISGVATTQGSCCHLLIEAPPPATTEAAKVSVSVPQDWVAVVQLAPPLNSAGKIRAACELSDFTGPPPVDAVIVFQRLTI